MMARGRDPETSSMDGLMLALRIAHIGGAVLWAGGAMVFLGFVAPAIARQGPSAEGVMADLLRPSRLPRYFAIVSTVTVAAGATLFWRDTNGFDPDILKLTSFRAFTVGGAFGAIAWVFAIFVLPRAVRRIGEAAAALRAVEGRPPIELLERMEAAQDRLRWSGIALLLCLGVAVVAMSVARYLP
jgi:uncharacterized membrane protein